MGCSLKFSSPAELSEESESCPLVQVDCKERAKLGEGEVNCSKAMEMSQIWTTVLQNRCNFLRGTCEGVV